jgi:hypothetical protein
MNPRRATVRRRHRRVPRAIAAAALLAVVPGAAAEDFAALGVVSDHDVVLAAGAAAVTAADVDGDGVRDPIAVFPGGVLIQLAAGPPLVLDYQATALAPGAALRGGRTELLLALEPGVILAADVTSGRERVLAELDATALAAGDVDGDGVSEVFALVGGSVVGIGADGSPLDPVAPEGDVLFLAAGDFLGRGRDQLALARAAGAIEVRDFLDDSPPLIEAPALIALASQPAGRRDRLLAVLGDPFTVAEIDLKGAAPALFAPGPGAVTVLDPFLFVRLREPSAAGTFVRGNVNGDAKVDISDGVAILLDLFLGQRAREPCRKALDADDSGALEITDAIALLLHLFANSPPPPPPYPAAGSDPTPDGLECPP